MPYLGIHLHFMFSINASPVHSRYNTTIDRTHPWQRRYIPYGINYCDDDCLVAFLPCSAKTSGSPALPPSAIGYSLFPWFSIIGAPTLSRLSPASFWSFNSSSPSNLLSLSSLFSPHPRSHLQVQACFLSILILFPSPLSSRYVSHSFSAVFHVPMLLPYPTPDPTGFLVRPTRHAKEMPHLLQIFRRPVLFIRARITRRYLFWSRVQCTVSSPPRPPPFQSRVSHWPLCADKLLPVNSS
ncbi:hypothetical protein BU24DRAFT_183794 [Aaosphaeria arxii CBS 175.79]|uniref:Uncharacterized protein n=1 Tax=Aaosphaeria arxii CBS 175.79 TaxID=1450172 RepID=A0A6A5XRA5_9PLEO|nr:uncharacterized protein BU24DRAFT_183794 [Aaosphaeria arxii CBS 175.79]KAF2015712.1 hypothetical protein BU24DRAFT_183794 [Aaosphaeria arxii CBS 175.79]